MDSHAHSIAAAASRRGSSHCRGTRSPRILELVSGNGRSTLFGLATLAAFAIAAPALAQQTETDEQSAARYFERLDQKKQGFFTLADMQRIEGKVFKRTDLDKDGTMTLSEYTDGIPSERNDVLERFTHRFRLADADKSGRVTLDEYMQFCANVVAAADTNQDGMVTLEEFVAATANGSAE